MSFSLWLTTQEKLCFDEQGIERVSGLRRHCTLYTEVRTIEMKLRPSRNGPAPVVLIGTSPKGPPAEIWPFNYEPGEARKMLLILSQRTPDTLWDQTARDLLDS